MSEKGNCDYISDILASHCGRDAVVRALGYFSLYLSAKTEGRTSSGLKTFSEDLSYCRLVLRLFDDLPMLRHTLNYGLGNQEPTFVLRILGVVKNVLDQLYYPVEHLAWAADRRFVRAKSSAFWSAGTVLWGLSSYINIVRSLILICILQRKTRGLKNVVLHEKIVGQQLEYVLMCAKDAADICLAIHFLPPGSLLWAGGLNPKGVGAIGTLSSLLRLVLLWRNVKNSS